MSSSSSDKISPPFTMMDARAYSFWNSHAHLGISCVQLCRVGRVIRPAARPGHVHRRIVKTLLTHCCPAACITQ